MYYVLVDSEGNRLGAFHDEQAAIEELHAEVEEDAAAADDLLLLTYHEDGGLEGPARMFAELPARPTSIFFRTEPPTTAIYFDVSIRTFQAAAAATGAAQPAPSMPDTTPAWPMWGLPTRVPV